MNGRLNMNFFHTAHTKAAETNNYDKKKVSLKTICAEDNSMMIHSVQGQKVSSSIMI